MDTDLADRRSTATVGSVCQALISSVQKTAMNVTAFVRRCRSARADLAPTTRELSELQMVLELLDDHGLQGGGQGAIPKELQAHLRPILTNCITAVLRVDGVLRQYGSKEAEGALSWTAQARDEVRDLERSLGTYRGVLGLVSDLVSILVSSGKDEGQGANSAGSITPDGLKWPDVLRELHALRSSALTSQSNATLAGQHLTLQVHLGHIIAYAETMAKSKDWEKAVKALEKAQGKTAAAEKEEVRGSIPVTAPLRKISATQETGASIGDNFIVLNRGFENLLVRDDGGRSTSFLFASHSTPEPGSLMAGGPSTGMMIMDGAGLPEMSGTNTSLQPIMRSNSGSANPRKHLGRRTSGQQQHAMIYTTEKEVAVPMTTGRRGPEEEITEEALAFAQVPVHILGRLSLNLVGHVYTGTTSHNPNEPNPGNMSRSSDQTSYNHSLMTMKTDEGYFDDGASARTSDEGSLHDGDLQFSQLDLSKPATSQPLPHSQSTLGSQTLFGAQIPASHQLMQQQPPPPQSLPPLPPAPPPPPLSQPLPPLPPSSQQAPPTTGHGHSLREMRSISTMNTHAFMNMQKPLPRTPLVYIPTYPGLFVKTKAVVVGNFSCGKTCLIT